MKQIPSRVLNENSVMLGLNQNDLIALAGSFYFLQLAFHPFNMDILSVIGTALTAVLLISLRLRFRRRLIRDFVSYKLTKLKQIVEG